MKKFYSLALIAAACTLSVSAKDANAVRAISADNAEMKVVSGKQVNSRAIINELTKPTSQRADRDLTGEHIYSGLITYKISETETETEDLEGVFTMTPTGNPNEYTVSGFFDEWFGSAGQDLTAEYIAGTVEGVFYEFLSFPADQVWASIQGKDYYMRLLGLSNSDGKVYFFTDEDDNYATIDFQLIEDNGEETWVLPASQNYTYLVGYLASDNRGNWFDGVEIFDPNCTFTAVNYTLNDDLTAVESELSATSKGYAYDARSVGKKYLVLPGMSCSLYGWTGGPIRLLVNSDGTATASDVLCGNFGSSEPYTPGYYCSLASTPTATAPAILTAQVVEDSDAGTTTVTFEDNDVSLVAVANAATGQLGSMGLGWANPTYVINKTFGLTAGVEKVEADAEFDENAPVEYFNLQGQRIANPEAGQLVIKKQGAKAAKVVIR